MQTKEGARIPVEIDVIDGVPVFRAVDRVQLFTTDDIRAVEIRRSGVLNGLILGLGIGIPTGVVVGLASGDDPETPYTWSLSSTEKAFVMGIALGGLGAAVGCAIGALAGGGTARYEVKPTPTVSRRGGALTLAWSF